MTFCPFNKTDELRKVATVCIGGGRFLRAVLVPAVEHLGGVLIAQPRGDNLVKSLEANDGVYEIDTVLTDGNVKITKHRVEACGSLSNVDARKKFMNLPEKLSNLRILAIGITENGFNEKNQTITDIAEFIIQIYVQRHEKTISLLNTDNVYENATKLKELILKQYVSNIKISDEGFLSWFETHIIFHNTMVDRIVSHRENDELVPRGEPLPSKAIVIEDLKRALPENFISSHSTGVVVCHEPGELTNYISLKLLIANATFSCMVYSMALSGLTSITCSFVKFPAFSQLIEDIFWRDILPTFEDEKIKIRAIQTFNEWTKRLEHRYLDMNAFFVSQDSTQKLIIRILPTVNALISKNRQPTNLLAYSVACMLRFLTPTSLSNNGIFTGKFPFLSSKSKIINKIFFYGPNLKVNLDLGEYQFRNDYDPTIPNKLFSIYNNYTKNDLTASNQIFNLLADDVFKFKDSTNILLSSWLDNVNFWYFFILKEELKSNPSSHLEILDKAIKENYWIKEKELHKIINDSVNTTPVIDVHTHLFPASHGESLFLYGIDEMLTYHYLVAEYFQTAPSEMTPEKFQKLEKHEQANEIWNELFIKRSPLSEACRGILTTLKEFGFDDVLEHRDLKNIRKWCKKLTEDEYTEMIFKLANVKYVIMTNIPYVDNEKKVWLSSSNRSVLTNKRFKSSLRIDLFMKQEWEPIADILTSEGFEPTKDGLRAYLEKWIEIIKPEYLMASPPPDFEYPGHLNLLDEIILPIALKHKLGLAMKFGAERSLNSRLDSAGDGVSVVSLNPLKNLCRNNPKIKFLVTFLSRVNQHELCVVANKFGNLHVYGCWWYCNNPSIINEITKMRIEMLGTSFTVQHSDARILDQIIYKWKHSRKIIADVLIEQYTNLLKTGWRLTQSELDRDIRRYFGGAYEEFLSKWS